MNGTERSGESREDGRSDPPRGSLLSTQAAGTLLAFLFVLVLAQINTILKDFRDAIFYSLMCSTALRYIKDRIVCRLVGLATDPDRTLLFYPLSLVFVKPVEFALGLRNETIQLVRKFEASVEGRRQRGSAQRAAWAHALADTVRHVRGNAGDGSGRNSKTSGSDTTSTVMLRFLIRLVALQLLVTWIKSTLSSASQVALLAISVTIGLGVATLSLLPYTSLGPLSPQKGRTPKRRRVTLGRTSLDEDDGVCTGAGHTRPAANDHAVDGKGGGDSGDRNEAEDARDARDAEDAEDINPGDDGDDVDGGKVSRLVVFVDKAVAPIRSFDAVLKRGIASSAHSLVSAVLILVLVLGSAIGATFLGYQIISECRDVGLSLKDTLSDLGSSGGQRSDDFLSEYRMHANEAIQEYLPVVFDWVESKSDYILQANNLTQAAAEGRLLMESIRGPRYCSRDEREKLLVALARAGAHTEGCKREESRLAELLAEKTFEFSTALRRFENTLEVADGDEDPGDIGAIEAIDTIEAAQKIHRIQMVENTETSDAPVPADQEASLSLEGILVRAEDELKQYHSEYTQASSELAKAQRSRVVAERRLALCSTGSLSSATSTPSVSGQHLRALHDVGTVIHGGFSKIIRSQDITGGILDTWNGLNGIIQGLFDSNGNDTAQNGSTSPAPPPSRMHIDSLQSIIQAATGPLISVGRALFLSTSAALVGTSSLFRFGASLLSFGMQSIIFLSLLFALLSAEDDPVASMIYHLPFPPAARNKAATALNKSLGGVFVTLFKLCVIHGLFTWVTFTFFDAPLVYLTSTASAAFSIVPFIPSWLVVTPSVTALAVQGRIIPGIILMGMHFAAYSFGDTEILNEAGGQPYLMSLSVFGGMYAMPANPFLGALAGPCFFSLGTALVRVPRCRMLLFLRSVSSPIPHPLSPSPFPIPCPRDRCSLHSTLDRPSLAACRSRSWENCKN